MRKTALFATLLVFGLMASTPVLAENFGCDVDHVCAGAARITLYGGQSQTITLGNQTFVIFLLGISNYSDGLHACFRVSSSNSVDTTCVPPSTKYTVGGLASYLRAANFVNESDQTQNSADLTFGEDSITCPEDCTVTNMTCDRADKNKDGLVDDTELASFNSCYQRSVNGMEGCSFWDLNNDGYVGFADLSLFRMVYLKCVPPARPANITCSQADYDHDGDVDPVDLYQFSRCYNKTFTPNCSFWDFNSDGKVDDADRTSFTSVYFQTCNTTIPSACTDSDGSNIYQRGTATNGTNTLTDYCDNQSGRYYEYTCSGNNIVAGAGFCPSGYICHEGACQNTSPCTDSEGGFNPYVKGTAKGYYGSSTVGYTAGMLYGSFTDYCYASSRPKTLIEISCNTTSWLTVPNMVWEYQYECPYLCRDGACVTPPNQPWCGDGICAGDAISQSWFNGGQITSMYVYGAIHNVTLVGLQNNALATISVDGVAQTVVMGSRYTISGIPVMLKEVDFVSNSDQTRNSAKIVIGENSDTCPEDCGPPTQNTTIPWCTDSDGMDIYVRGENTGTLITGAPANYTDTCVIFNPENRYGGIGSINECSGSNCGVGEGSCKSCENNSNCATRQGSFVNNPVITNDGIIPCPNGCKNGVCLRANNTENNQTNQTQPQESTTKCEAYYDCPDGSRRQYCSLYKTYDAAGNVIGTACACKANPSSLCSAGGMPPSPPANPPSSLNGTDRNETPLFCDGCIFANRCVPIGYRSAGRYCNISSEFAPQAAENQACQNNFECQSNLCVADKCVAKNIIQLIIEWFLALFGIKS